MGSAGGSESVTTSVVRPGAGGVVARPGLLQRLGAAARVTVVSAPAGSGKTVLLRSWIDAAGLADSTAWVPVGRDERDPQRFWLSVLGALRRTSAGSGLVRELTPAPDLDGWAITELLLKDLTSLLRFSVAQARDMFAAAGVQLPDPALALLYERTEGWAAGLRLAALSLAGHDDPEGFAAEFSGTERTVAEYLLAEVLDRQAADVRQLLLRTSVLERVSGPLADAMTGSPGGELILQQLEEANAFVVSLDAARSWFRYHNLFADLLQRELRRTTAQEEVTALHQAAASWFAGHGFPVEAIRRRSI